MRLRTFVLLLFSFLAFAVIPYAHGARDWYVRTNGLDTAATDWNSAYTNIQRAISEAGNGDTIYLAGQTFPLTNQLVWEGKTNMNLRGGYAATNNLEQPGTPEPALWPTVFTLASGVSNRLILATNVANSTISRITFTGGKFVTSADSGGGGLRIENCSDLWLIDCLVTGNSVQDTSPSSGTVYGNGLYLSKSLMTLSNCVISANTGSSGNAQGGGLYMSGGTTTVWGTTIAFNQLSYIYTRQGGGIYNNNGKCFLRNSLVVGNGTTGGGGGDGVYSAGASGLTALENCTVADNAGQGINRSAGTVTVTNCIVWGNGADLVGNPIAIAYCNIQAPHSAWTNEVNGCISQDPGFERGYYLASGSPCVNAGTNDASTWGLDGFTTRTDGTPDAGRVNLGYHYAAAYEFAGADYYVATNGADTTGTNWDEAFKTVTRALSVARNGTIIYLDAGTYSLNSGETFPLTLANRIGVKISGTSRTGTVINAAGSGKRVMTLTACANVELSDLTLTGGTNAINGNVYGGGLYLFGCGGIRLLAVGITDNIAKNNTTGSGTSFGGGVYTESVNLLLSNCVVNGNSALGGNSLGCGICAQNGGTLTVIDTVLSNNKGSSLYTRNGGGVYNSGVACRFRNCLIVGNTSLLGGGLYQVSGTLLVENCTVADNTVQGINRAGGTVTVTNSIAWGNTDDLVGTISVGYCAIETADTFWTNEVNGCINQNPSFDRGYFLAEGSPGVNAGTNDASFWGLDAYSTRFDGTLDSGRVDLGYHIFPDSVASFCSDYYVATNGMDTWSGTNWVEAFRTVTKAFTMVQDGVTVHIGLGSFSTNSGEVFPLTLSSRLGVRVDGSSRTGTVINAAGSGQRGMTVSGCANVTLANLTLTGGTISQSGNVYGGGLSLANCGSFTLENCGITNNSVQNLAHASYASYGGGVYATASGLTLTHCVISGNSALSGGNSYGGGISTANGGTLTLENTILSGNLCSASYTIQGGGIYGSDAQLRNCLVVGNQATAGSGIGGGLYAVAGGGWRLENCTVADNIGQGVNGGATVVATNCIFWGNGDDLVGSISVAYCDIQTADTFWTNAINGCISIDPKFAGAAGGDYQLANGSPVANKGITLDWMTSIATDLAGNLRIQGGNVDMGAYESSIGSGTMFIFR